MKWNKTIDRLPINKNSYNKKVIVVLVYNQINGVDTALYNPDTNDFIHKYNYHVMVNITHWMNLPEKPNQ